MTGEQIRDLYTATPFKPFRVHMANGRSLDIPHPDFMLLSPTGRRLTVEREDVDAAEIIDVLLITSVEVLPRNGSKRRRTRKK